MVRHEIRFNSVEYDIFLMSEGVLTPKVLEIVVQTVKPLLLEMNAWATNRKFGIKLSKVNTFFTLNKDPS